MKFLQRLFSSWVWQTLDEPAFCITRLAHCSFRYVNRTLGYSVDFYSEPGDGKALIDLKELDFWTHPAGREVTDGERDEALLRIAAFFEMNGFKLVTIRTGGSVGEQP